MSIKILLFDLFGIVSIPHLFPFVNKKNKNRGVNLDSAVFYNSVCKPGSVENGHQSSLVVTDELRVAPCHLRICVGQTIRIRCCFG